ncbi:MAG: phosphatase PAP2 family protein, partial [Deltaproteobacteria bacterium]|nr:phosphatase PAP2 family protein [Deltaproteobacteria bacterium]
IYVLYPAAPPWYVMSHGPGPADPAAIASPAGAARFDELLGITFFANFYARNPNVFGAMPSLHAAYPTLVACHVWRFGWRFRIPAVAFALLVGFSAVYLRHHYVLDVLAGVAVSLVATGALAVAEQWWSRRQVAAVAPSLSGQAS